MENNNTNPAEFDKFAEDYSKNAEDNIMRMLGKEHSIFWNQKVYYLEKEIQKKNINKNAKVLDFGCGTGDMISGLYENNNSYDSHGVDVSPKIIEEAKKLYPNGLNFTSFDGARTPYEDNTFDVIFSSCVFHHIPPEQWASMTKELNRILKKDGLIIIFEHNPWNPVTKHIVNHCPVDENAVLLSSPTFKKLYIGAGFQNVKVKYMIFFPPRMKSLWSLESFINFIPLGGQYYITGTKN